MYEPMYIIHQLGVPNSQAVNFVDTISQRGLVQWAIEPTYHSLNRNYHSLLQFTHVYK